MYVITSKYGTSAVGSYLRHSTIDPNTVVLYTYKHNAVVVFCLFVFLLYFHYDTRTVLYLEGNMKQYQASRDSVAPKPPSV